MKVTKELLSLSSPSFRNIPSTTIEDTARRRAPIARKVYTLKERIARERAAYSAKMKAKSERRREQDRRRAEYQVQKAAKAALAQKMETTSIHKAAGITPQVRRLAAEGHKGAIQFLTAARQRVRSAQGYLSKNPTSYTMGRGRYRVTRTYKNKGFTMGVVHTIAAGQSVSSFRQLYDRETKALGRAKGAAKGASLKAGQSGSDKGGGQAGGKVYRVNLFDAVGITSSVKAARVEDKAAPKGSQQVSGGGLPGSIGSQTSPITFVNTTGFSGQPIGNTLDFARAQKLAEENKDLPIQHPMDLRKAPGVIVDVYDREGKVIARTTTQESKEIAYGGLMNSPEELSRHFKIKLGGDGSLSRFYTSPFAQSMFYGVGLAMAEKESYNKPYYKNLAGIYVKNIVGPSNVGFEKKGKHPLEVAQDYAYAHLKLTQKHPLLFPPLEESRAGTALTVISLGVGIVNLEKQARQFFSKQTSGFALEEKDYLKEIKEPGGEFISGTIEKTISTGGNIFDGFSEGGKRFMESAKDFGILGTIGNIGLYVAPVGRLPKPVSPFHVMTKEGAVLVSKQLAVPLPRQHAFTLGGKYTEEFGGKFFVGKPKFKDIPYETRYDIPPMSRGFEHVGVKATQQSIQRSHMPQMELAGLVKKGSATYEKSAQKQLRVELRQKQKLEKKLPTRLLDALSKKEQSNILTIAAKQQKNKFIDAAKGSLLGNLIKSSKFTAYSQGKINPIVKSFKTSRTVQQDIMRIMSEKNLQRKIKDLDFDEIKEGTGLLAAKNILKAKMDKGTTLSRKASNIFVERPGSKPQEVINIPKIRDDGLEAIEAGMIGLTPLKKTGKVFEMKFPGKKHKIGIPGSSSKLSIYDPKYQSAAKTISNLALQSKQSLLQTRGMTEGTAKKMLGGARTAMSPFGPRSTKDPVDAYMAGLKSIKLSMKEGKYAQAAKTAEHLQRTRDYYNWIGWEKELKAWKPKLEFTHPDKVITKGGDGSINLGEISSAYGTPLDIGLKGTSLYGSPSASISLTPEVIKTKTNFAEVSINLNPQRYSQLGEYEFYHAGDISGRVSAGEIGSPRDAGFFLTKSVSTALRFGDGDNLYKVTIKDKAKILKQIVEDDDGPGGIAYAKKKKYQALDRPISTLAGGDGDRELIVLDSTIIKSVQKIKKSKQIRSPLSPKSPTSVKSVSSIPGYSSLYSISKSSNVYSKASRQSVYSPRLSTKSPVVSPLPPSKSPSPFVPSPKPSPFVPSTFVPSPLVPSPPSPAPSGTTPSTIPSSLTGGQSAIIRTPRQPKGLFVNIRIRTDEAIRRPRKHRADFLGNTHVAKITGFAKRAEITYGRKKTFYLTEEDIKKSAKGKFEKRKPPRMILAKHKNLFTASKKIRL